VNQRNQQGPFLTRLAAIDVNGNSIVVASSRINQLATLARGIEGKEALRQFITGEVWSPEQLLLQTIMQGWRSLVSGAGRLGKQVLTEAVANPYMVANTN
jgi:hypothetical protein